MLELNLTLFTYPGETGCCPLQPSKDFNLKVSVIVRQAKIIYMHEHFMRMVDYIIN